MVFSTLDPFYPPFRILLEVQTFPELSALKITTDVTGLLQPKVLGPGT